jgi:HprK-related kinase A
VKVCELSLPEISDRMRHNGLFLRIGPFVVCLHSTFHSLTDAIQNLYPHNQVLDDQDFADIHIRITPRWDRLPRWRVRARLILDGDREYRHFSSDEAIAYFEWGMNWFINTHAHQYLILHSAAVAWDDNAVIMPASSGDGKSTLCAALACTGWRLLSDELGLVCTSSGKIAPLARPVILKNGSIDIIRRHAPHTVWERNFKFRIDGARGAFVKPSAESVAAAQRLAFPRFIIFPKFRENAALQMTPVSKGQAFLRIAQNSFNFARLGPIGFDAAIRLINACECFEMAYGRLESALAAFHDLMPQPEPGGSAAS